MTEQDKEIQELRRKNERLAALLREAIRDINLILFDEQPRCSICAYADADCPKGKCVPKWRGL